jgi:DNA damage-inducible protein 1
MVASFSGAADAGGAAAGALPMFDFSNIQVPPGASSSRSVPPAANTDNPTVLREMLLADPSALSMLRQNNPRLADALTSIGNEQWLFKRVYSL